MAPHSSKPPFDPALEAFMAQLSIAKEINLEIIPMIRTTLWQAHTAEIVISGKAIKHKEIQIPVPGGEITLSIFEPANRPDNQEPGPGIYYVHGGGFLVGNRFMGMSVVTEWVEKLNATCISVEYRLAPEHPYPIPLNDCYAGLKWVSSHLSELGIDESRLMLAGQSAGGGLAAALALRARDEGGPRLCAQLLMCPMLDHRNDSVSCRQFETEGTWSRQKNKVAWSCYLGDHGKGEGEAVDILASPGLAIADDLSGLPTTFIDVGSAEAFRDENIAYSSRLFEAGVQVELHVWPGGVHGFDLLMPTAEISQRAIRTRTAWVANILSSPE
ncbi:alpha/beta hydrolase fold-3 domain-containing protein [Penicillium verhagenii]|uniref:alpha/beta hydrolase fold-3 domain-containing protein n=1 Tax=Penicillium verhagenii TaxID=1562060 RepID=UPI002544D7BB|nr:alpha/beta hydrolase fold-3 domain-containing protein [Penicillium verhagenii]KAJ5927852.1 alpha/beta hydrolase fold-3 domain-containing protein [Penicillium verhagenii]